MTLWSCKVKKEDKIGAGSQKMAVNLSLIEQYAGQSSDVHLLLCQNNRTPLNVTRRLCFFFAGPFETFRNSRFALSTPVWQ